MDCSRVRDLLPDYSVEILDARTRAQVERHLAACVACHEELRAEDDVMALVEQFGVRQPPAGLFNAVRNRIEAGDLVREQPAWWSWFYTRPARAFAMGTAVAALALALFLPTGPGGTGSLGRLPVNETISSGPTSTALAGSIRQHAMAAGEGPLADRVAWEAMAQLAVQGQENRAPGVQ